MARMTASGWREEGLLASGPADGGAGIGFCPSVNHPAWFAELQGGKTQAELFWLCPLDSLVKGDKSDRDAA